MRLVRFLAAAVLLLGTVYAALWVGMRGADLAEGVLERRIAEALEAARLDWAVAEADGLVVRLAGTAPDRFAREMTREVVAEATGPGVEIVEDIALIRPGAPEAPLALTLVREGEGRRLLVTGQVPDAEARRRLLSAIRTAARGLALEPMVGTGARAPAADPLPAIRVAARAAALLAKARIEMRPGAVSVSGVAAGEAEQRAISAELRAAAGEAVALELDLATPPPVIAPFEVALEKGPDGEILRTRCAARGAEEARLIEGLTRPAAAGSAPCRVGLGGPAGDWPGAVAAGAAALQRLPSGRFRLAYRDAVLALPPAAGAQARAAAEAVLAAWLPDGYGLRLVEAPAHGMAEGGAEAPAPGYWLHLVRRGGAVVVAGRMPDRTGVAAIEALASASFAGRGPAPRLALSVGQGPAPEDWQRAAIAAVEAVAGLAEGEAALGAARLRIEGRVDDPAEIGRLHRRLSERLPGYEVRTRLTVDLPRLVAAVPLTAARCAVLLNAEMARRGVGFAPGSAVIDAEGPGVLDRAAAILRRCPEARIEIGGHTDSQGSAGFNRRLSRARAEAVRAGLAARGIAGSRLGVEGYGESRPVASNDTPEGRARNRRIAFRPMETAS